MENMKAVRVHNYGGREVLRFEDAPRPTPGSGELLIMVHAASVNPIDWKVRAGYMKDYIPLPMPFIPGWDVSGVVEVVGSGVTKFKKGDEVYARPDVTAHGYGAYAEYVVAKERETALKPKSIDHVHATTIPVGAVTAWRALFDTAGLKEGPWQKILEGLPSVVCVRNAVVADASGGFAPILPKAATATSSRSKSRSTRKSRPTKKS